MTEERMIERMSEEDRVEWRGRRQTVHKERYLQSQQNNQFD
jgi:hypothetical protein